MRPSHLGTLVLLLCATAAHAATPLALFDNTKAETAGNADWIIDTDQPAPLPDQTTVGPATPRTYWLGAISSWGIDLVKRGYRVATLTSTYGITYGNLANVYDLSKCDVFIVDEPNTKFTSAESTAVYQFVADGGGLIAVSDHDVSDRNGDGWDSPHIWNALGIEARWGIRCSVSPDAAALANFSQDSGNQTADLTDPVIYGPDGVADSLSFHNGTSFTVDPTVNPTIRGLVWKQGVAQSSLNQLMAVRLQYGSGRVVFVGDSSPCDDGSAQPGNSSIFDGWGEAAGRDSILFLNATRWATRIIDTTPPAVAVIAPNGGEAWVSGSTHAVQWSATDAGGVDSVSVLYSLNGLGGGWTLAGSSLANSGSWSWLTPVANSNDVRVKVVAFDHRFNQGSDVSDASFTLAATTGVGPGGSGFEFAPVRPNPGSAIQDLRFRLPLGGPVRLRIVDVSGRVLWSRAWETLGAGEHHVAWAGRDDSGRAVSAGLFFARLETPFGVRTRRFTRTR